MTVSNAQVRKMMAEFSKHGQIEMASIHSDMDRKTAAKYLKLGKYPSENKTERTWRTRLDPFEEDWSHIAQMLENAPELEAKALFEYLLETKADRYQPGQLRTFQRRFKQWRAKEGPHKEVFFAQEHRPGEALQTDFTWCNELCITLSGEPFAHKLCHSVLPYSNWQWATVCLSESILALRHQIQHVAFRLGRVPQYHQTDHSSAATHYLASGGHQFNEDYVKMVRYFQMEPRTTAVGEKEQNGDVEAANGALKRRLKQHLLLRGSRDFEHVEGYEQWVQGVMERANDLRRNKVAEELKVMRPVNVERLLEFTEETQVVSGWSTIRVKQNSYSVPSRLIGEEVKVRIYEGTLEVWYGGERQLTMERILGCNKHRIDYRHIIWSLVRKPGAFARYKYREELFPTAVFRKTYDTLAEALKGWQADVEYLQILHLAASTMEAEVESALELLLEQKAVPRIAQVKALVSTRLPSVPAMAAYEINLNAYDALLGGMQEVGS
jgi:hypothetical protein